MGTTLTGTTPQDTYDSLIKVTDNGPISGTLKALSDGLGNDSTLSLSTTAASIAGTLAVTGNATFDTNTLFVDAAANEVGIGTTSPSGKLHISAPSGVASLGSTALAIRDSVAPDYGFDFTLEGVSSGDMSLVRTELDVQSQVMTFKRSNGNVGIGNSAPTATLDVNSGTTNIVAAFRSTDAGAFLGIADPDTTLDSGFPTSTCGVIGNNFLINTANTERMRLTSDGYLRMASGSLGIQFNGDTAAANALDDYEEGTWTPTNASDATGTLSSVTGTYTKIGNLVTVRGIFTVDTNFTSNTIGGLPFTIAGGGSSSIYGGTIAINNSTNNVVTSVSAGSTTIVFYTGGDATAPYLPTTTNATFRVSFTYFVS